MLESKYTSSQSFWENGHTIRALELLNKKGYTVLLTHRQDSNLNKYNQICRTFTIDMSYRAMPRFYNKSCGFIGVSSGISCAVHTNQCKKNIPHLEFVNGEHWSTRHYKHSNKTISFRDNINYILRLIDNKIPNA